MEGRKRESWATNWGFILASVGCAVGLGNVWMFPWRLGAHGGAAFLIIYLALMFGVVVVGLMAEFAFGRSQQKGIIGSIEGAFSERFGKKGKTVGGRIGFFPIIGGVGIAVFYCIVVGWILKYFILAIGGAFPGMNMPEYFGGFVGSPQTIGFLALALVIGAGIVVFGIRKGIERASKIMMPVLFVMMIILAIRSVTLPGAAEGLRFMFVPDWSKMLEFETWVMALGQAFFSVSLGGGMLVYGSYLRRDQNLPQSAFRTAGLDTMAALTAAFIVIPAAFAFGLEPGAGPGLLFITMPALFTLMPQGYFFGVVFFFCMLFAVISSEINFIEVIAEAFMDRLKWGRKLAVGVTALVIFLIGIPLATNMTLFTRWTDIFSIYVAPIGAVLLAVSFFWIYGVSKAREEINIGSTWEFFRGKWLATYGKYVFVSVTIVIVVLGIIFKGI